MVSWTPDSPMRIGSFDVGREEVEDGPDGVDVGDARGAVGQDDVRLDQDPLPPDRAHDLVLEELERLEDDVIAVRPLDQGDPGGGRRSSGYERRSGRRRARRRRAEKALPRAQDPAQGRAAHGPGAESQEIPPGERLVGSWRLLLRPPVIAADTSKPATFVRIL